MISYLQLENLTKSHGDRMIFADVTFGINQGDKIALIAKNARARPPCCAASPGRNPPIPAPSPRART